MDGYICEKIKTGPFTSKKVEFLFGMHVWLSIAIEREVALDDFGKLDPAEVAIDTLYYGAQWAEYKFGKRRTITRDKVVKWMDHITVPQMQRIQKTIEQSKVGGKTILQHKQSADKKKQPQKK